MQVTPIGGWPRGPPEARHSPGSGHVVTMPLRRTSVTRRPPMSMTQPPAPLKTDPVQHQLDQLIAFVGTALHNHEPLHALERGLWVRLLQLGHQLLAQVFAQQGSGDVGDSVRLPDGRDVHRLPDLHERRYVSPFGEFRLRRAAYGSREGQKIDFVPLDNRLPLPASPFSYLLQDWDQALC